MSELPPIVGITAGDPAGIGPEVALAAAVTALAEGFAAPVLIGDVAAFEPAHRTFFSAVPIMVVPPDPDAIRAALASSALPLIAAGELSEELPLGAESLRGGFASYLYVRLAIELLRERVIPAVTTAPISKHAWSLAGVHYPGHTEVFAEAFAPKHSAMLLLSPRLNVALATVHVSLLDAIAQLTTERIVETGRLLAETLERSGVAHPLIAVLGLNPHAGENGMFGREEIELIAPAVSQLREMGILVDGPIPTDTAFTPAALARYRGHLCLYHDQGLIPFKALSFHDGVNMTAGLEGAIRTSPDHGTAYAIAGTGEANPRSMIEAVRLAARLARF